MRGTPMTCLIILSILGLFVNCLKKTYGWPSSYIMWSRIIQVAVETSLNYVKTTAAMSVAWKETISNLLEHCWSLWLQADNEARIKAREEENLYRYKVTSHQITESEEEEELANLFPSYEDEFPSEEEQAGNDVCMDLGRETQETTLSEKPSCQFSSEDMHKICCLHLLSCSRSYKSGTISMLDVKGPIHQAYQIAGRLSSISDNIQGLYRWPYLLCIAMLQ